MQALPLPFIAIFPISSVRLRKVKPGKAVWFDRTAVGMTHVSTPMHEMTGSAAVSEHLPIQDMS